MTDIVPADVRVTALMREMNRWKLRAFQWSEMDCCTTLGDWVARVTGRDPAAHLRGLYDSPADCQRLTGFLTDPVGAIEACLYTIGGLPRVETPRRGDVAVYRRLGERWPFGGVWLGELWVSKGRDSVTYLSPEIVQPLAIWRLGYAE